MPPPPQQPRPLQPSHVWNVPMVLPPPKKSRVGLVIGIAGGVFVGVLAVLLTLVVIEANTGFPEAHFALTLPKTLLDGRYELTQDLSDSVGRKMEKESRNVWDAKITHGVAGRYSLDGAPARGGLVITGFYGRFKNVDETRFTALKRDGEAASTVVVPPRDVTPSGAAVRISCEVLSRKGPTWTVTYPVCAWADGNTSALVAEMVFGAVNADLDLKSAARTTLQVRSETVKAIK